VADLFAASLSAPLDFADADAVETELHNLERNPEVSCAAVFDTKGAAFGASIARACDPSGRVELGDPIVLPDRVEVTRAVVGRTGTEVGRRGLPSPLRARTRCSRRLARGSSSLRSASHSVSRSCFSRSHAARSFRRGRV
jgi:hypothetical protein